MNPTAIFITFLRVPFRYLQEDAQPRQGLELSGVRENPFPGLSLVPPSGTMFPSGVICIEEFLILHSLLFLCSMEETGKILVKILHILEIEVDLGVKTVCKVVFTRTGMGSRVELLLLSSLCALSGKVSLTAKPIP